MTWWTVTGNHRLHEHVDRSDVVPRNIGWGLGRSRTGWKGQVPCRQGGKDNGSGFKVLDTARWAKENLECRLSGRSESPVGLNRSWRGVSVVGELT